MGGAIERRARLHGLGRREALESTLTGGRIELLGSFLRTLAEQQGNMSRTADVLGVERSNLYRKMKAFGIAPSRRADEETETV